MVYACGPSSKRLAKLPRSFELLKPGDGGGDADAEVSVGTKELMHSSAYLGLEDGVFQGEPRSLFMSPIPHMKEVNETCIDIIQIRGLAFCARQRRQKSVPIR